MSGNATHNTHNPFTGDGVVNTHNPLTGDKTGPHPPPGTNPVTGRTRDGELGRNEQHHPDAGHTGTGFTSGTNTHNTHNPMTGNGVTNTRNPMTGDTTGPHPTSGATHTGTGHVGATGTNTHNTHNPLTGDGVHNTHNPLTGDKTGPNPPPGTNPVTGRTNDGNLGRHEPQGAGYNTTAGTAGTHTGAGNVGTMGSGSHNTHNTHNPLTGDGVNNTHNPLTGDKTGPHPPAGTNPVTGRTNDGNLGRHEQHGVGQTGVMGTGPDAIHDTTRGTHATTGTHGTHTAGTHTTGAHPTSNQTSGGGGAKALVGKVEATLGNILKNPDMHAKGVQKQEEAAAAKATRTEGNATHTGAGTNLSPHAAAVGTADEPRH